MQTNQYYLAIFSGVGQLVRGAAFRDRPPDLEASCPVSDCLYPLPVTALAQGDAVQIVHR
jgi:hypothetical protein